MIMRKLKVLISILLSMMLIFTMTACGSKTEPEPEEETQTEEQTETQTDEPAEYDIASNLQIANGVDGEGGNTQVIDTDHFTLTLSHGGTWDYTVDSKTSITIYNIASREADCGGRLVSIIAYDTGDKDYEMLPSYGVIGEKDGKVYIAEYPSDVQFNFEDEQATADYQAVYDELNKIRDGSGDSPIVLK